MLKTVSCEGANETFPVVTAEKSRIVPRDIFILKHKVPIAISHLFVHYKNSDGFQIIINNIGIFLIKNGKLI